MALSLVIISEIIMPIYCNQQLIETFNFSGGECQVKLPKICDFEKEAHIKAVLRNSDDILCLLLAVDAVRRLNPLVQLYLTIPYVPYARQDRVCADGEALSICVMANLINSLKANKVTILDPHSDVTSALIHNVVIKTIGEVIHNSILETHIFADKLILVSPDAGAEKKVRTLAKTLSKKSSDIEVITATKVRDPKSGDIIETHIYGIKPDCSYLIVDDICDGGRTFIELAKVMKQQGAATISLYVTHGIFSRGLTTLFNYFDHIYCAHTWLENETAQKLIILGE